MTVSLFQFLVFLYLLDRNSMKIDSGATQILLCESKTLCNNQVPDLPLPVMKNIDDRTNTNLTSKVKNYAYKFLKFGSVGAFTSVLGLTLNTIFLKFFNTHLFYTYACVYLFNILISYLLNSFFTFKSKVTGKRMALYYGVYFSSMLLGLLSLKLFKTAIDLENWIYPFMVYPITMTYNFLIVQKFLKEDR